MVPTSIGQRLHSSPGRVRIAVIASILIVIADFALILWFRPWHHRCIEGRGALAVVAVILNIWLVQGDLASVGFVKPAQGFWYWCRATLLIGLMVGALLVTCAPAWVLSGRELPLYSIDPQYLLEDLLHMCVFAPVLEEAVYRLALCVPLCAAIGPTKTIVASGLVFGGLHVAYGNPSPENLVGGLFLAWAYWKSGSILVPVAMHGFGNLVAVFGQLATWYWLKGGF
jgi:uncharacterized protein